MTFLDVAPLVSVAGAGLALYKQQTGLAVALAAAGAGLWWWNRHQQAALIPPGSTQVSPYADPGLLSVGAAAVSNTLGPQAQVPFQIVPGTSAPQTALATVQYQAWLNHIATLPPGSALPPPPPPNATTYTPPPPPPPPSAYVSAVRNGQVVSYIPEARSGRNRF